MRPRLLDLEYIGGLLLAELGASCDHSFEGSADAKNPRALAQGLGGDL